MEFQLKNIGMIKEANVKLDGLTVIAGENNTGKSTVGKIIFSIIKASSRYKEDLEEGKEERIFSLIEKNYFQLRRKVDYSKNIEIRKIFYPPAFIRDIKRTSLINAIDERLKILDTLKQQSLFDSIETKDASLIIESEKKLLDLKKIALTKENKTEIQKRAFQKVLISEFKGKVTNQNFDQKSSFIKGTEGENIIFDVEMSKNKVKHFHIYDELYFTDASFIETPVLLQLFESIENSKTYFEEVEKDDRILLNKRPNTTLHVKDLISKLKESVYIEDFSDFDMFFSDETTDDLVNQLFGIIKGNIKYNKKAKDFIFISANGETFNSINTATGIKSFGIIQMLVKSGFIDERSLLILDEPEVHLHPKWQIKYAELITNLVKANITVLVTSHSPYMIEALQRYSEREKITADFYLAENGNINKVDNNNSDTLSKIFEKLSEPFDVFDEMDSEKLQNG
ncbi:hypothetical protein YH65_09380 [Sulfurovum lithotrophicum]|uniref:Endonuclease GajA/Old nuclease/RecF-like AAA domain-containing protein n=1 Tax=Sulfurovum lithotrophicum TaxID=206403 RepID=A0A7U4M2E7_9BACT|nr:AAA family ATPase [Sulfurovum lithotrophicum]AKF25565.1 hypothetical protein YH65_09380 [Sulfurovum lithotrophicum]